MMHAGEVRTDVALVRRLLASQFPHWAALPIEPVASSGTDNALYRLGAGLVARLPRIHWATDIDHEYAWLPRLAPLLPVAIPIPVAKGGPAFGYPWNWSVYRWLDGENPVVGAIADPGLLARDLVRFIAALRQADTTGVPRSDRGVPLAGRDDETRAAVAALNGVIDTGLATAAWEAALRAPGWTGPQTWLHGDLSPGNLLVREGRLAAVIDFACAGVGDPACDLIVAWNLLPAGTRAAFRAGLGADDATWARGRGWALSIALLQLPYYQDTNTVLAANARHVIGAVMADYQRAR